MKAFLQGIVAMLAVTVLAAAVLKFVPGSSQQIYQDREHVRL